MPARRRYIDAETGDYVLESGGPKNDSTAGSAVVFRFRLQRGSSPLFPTLGSRFHTIRKLAKDTPRLCEVFAREAVQDLIDRGDITEWSAQGLVEGSRYGVSASFHDKSGKQSVRFLRKVG